MTLDDARDHLADARRAFEDRGDLLVLADGEGFEHHLIANPAEEDRRPAIARATSACRAFGRASSGTSTA